MRMKKLVFVLVFLVLVGGVLAINLHPKLSMRSRLMDSQQQCFKGDSTGWECDRDFRSKPQGYVKHSVYGVSPVFEQRYYKPRRGEFSEVVDVQVKLNGIRGEPGNNLLARSAWLTDDLFDGGCWVASEGKNYVTNPGVNCNKLGGEGYRVLGFEFLSRSRLNTFRYDLSEFLLPGFYYVKPLVVRNGAPVDGGLHSGDGSGDYGLLLAERYGPIYFAVVPEI